jgi:uncharacterized protein YjbI with pentapeptide repeats
MGVYLTDVHLMGVYLINVHLTDVHLMGAYLMGVYLTGVHLMSVYLTGVHLMGVHLTNDATRKVGQKLPWKGYPGSHFHLKSCECCCG